LILENLKLNDSKTLMVIQDYDNNVYLSSRNLPKAKVMKAADLNTYEIMNAKIVILLENSVKVIEESLNK
jgi:large subunit ribosomal protein L4